MWQSIKGQAITYHLTHVTLPRYDLVKTDFPDEDILCADILEAKDNTWVTYFDGALNQNGKGVGMVLLSPEWVTIPKAFKIGFPVTNNIMEYKALLASLNEAKTLGVKKLRVLEDSKMVISN